MNITEFAASRGVRRETVSIYIKRHPEISAHVTKSGNESVLDDEAVSMLAEQYPVPAPVPVIEDAEARAEVERLRSLLMQAQARIIELQDQQIATTKALSDANVQVKSLEEHAAQQVALEEKINQDRERETARADAAEEHVRKLLSRGIWARIRNKDE